MGVATSSDRDDLIHVFYIHDPAPDVIDGCKEIIHGIYHSGQHINDIDESGCACGRFHRKEHTYIRFDEVTKYTLSTTEDNRFEYGNNNLELFLNKQKHVKKFWNYTHFVKSIDNVDDYINGIIKCYAIDPKKCKINIKKEKDYDLHIYININEDLKSIIDEMYKAKPKATPEIPKQKFDFELLPPDKFAISHNSGVPKGIHPTRHQMNMSMEDGKMVIKYSNYPDVYDAYIKGLYV